MQGTYLWEYTFEVGFLKNFPTTIEYTTEGESGIKHKKNEENIVEIQDKFPCCGKMWVRLALFNCERLSRRFCRQIL